MAKKTRPPNPKSKKVQSRPRLPGELATPRVAIRNQCLQCVGGGWSDVRSCEAASCWLYPWRLGNAAQAEEIVKDEKATHQ